MRYSKFFIPTLRDDPAEAQIISHKLMLRAGMIQQIASGIYAWLPLATRVLQKISQIVREEQDKIGSCETLLPTIQPTTLWNESGRYDAYGEEVLRMQDRQNRELFYGPTAEEVMTDVFRTHVKSYKQLPLALYQIHWKFRDEIRPRFGVMRGREFLMKDAYTFDIDEDHARQSYRKMLKAYVSTFSRMGLTAIPVKADSGAIGGDLSHEFMVLAETGESKIYYDGKTYNDLVRTVSSDTDIDLEKFLNIYAVSDEVHNPEKCPVAPDDLKVVRGIEVGHIFYLGQKYSRPLNACVAGLDGKPQPVHMGCYGIGISRLLGAIVESSHDEKGIIWPVNVAPFQIALMNLNVKDPDTVSTCDNLYQKLRDYGYDVLYDDRAERPGVKFSDMDLMGIPYQVIVGPKGIKANQIEIKYRKDGNTHVVSLDQIVPFFQDKLMMRTT